MTTTSTGAPCAHPSPTLIAASKIAVDIQSHVHRLESLAQAIDDAIDFPGIPDERMREGVGRAVDFLHLHREITPKVLELALQIESMDLRARCGSAEGEA